MSFTISIGEVTPSWIRGGAKYIQSENSLVDTIQKGYGHGEMIEVHLNMLCTIFFMKNSSAIDLKCIYSKS